MSASRPLRLCVVGRGRVGRGVVRALAGADVRVSRSAGRATAAELERAIRGVDVVWLCVPDAAIPQVAARVGAAVAPAPTTLVVLHAAGALGPEALAPLEGRAVLGALHPLVSFADASHPPSLARTTFVAQGPPAAIRAARRVTRACGASLVVAPASLDRRVYHAAAALLANGAAALATTALALLEAAGLPGGAPADRALAGLLGSVAGNVARLGPARALTGPVVRGDATTIAGHLRGLEVRAPEHLDSYRDVGRAILHVARGRGLDPAAAAALEALLETEPPAGRVGRVRRGRRSP